MRGLKLIAILLVVLLVACARQNLPDAQSAGAHSFVKVCGRCHDLPHPARHSASEWLAVMRIMQQRMRERGVAPLGDVQRQSILGYLQTHAR